MKFCLDFEEKGFNVKGNFIKSADPKGHCENRVNINRRF